MSALTRLLFVLCLFTLLIVLPIAAQEESAEEATEETAEEPAPSLDEARTIADVRTYIEYEIAKHDWKTYDPKKAAAVLAEINMPASDKLLILVKESTNPLDIVYAYQTKLNAFVHLLVAEAEDAEQKLDAFLNELESNEENLENPTITYFLRQGRFLLFQSKMAKAEVSPENFDEFKNELKTWIDRNDYEMLAVARLGIRIAEKNNVSAERFVKKTTAYIQSEPCPLSASEKADAVAAFERVLRTTLGSDPKLYGKTLSYRNFSWESLRNRYVLIHFTSTWSVPCRKELPGMKEVYEKYNDRGLEIVSVYVMEFGTETEQIAKVREHAEKKEKLPWFVISETLTVTSKQQKQSEFYALKSVPTMLLVDHEGKIILTDARGDKLHDKLKEIFRF